MSYKTIIVDDEIPALTKLSYLLKEYTAFDVVGSFSDSMEALESIDSLQPQVAFLDIAMPGLTGIQLADRIKERVSYPIKIIFVTAYDNYAVTAFDLDAADYLLKPVSKQRFQKTIERVQDSLSMTISSTANTELANVSDAQNPMVHSFGKLEITSFETSKPEWRTAKVRELFAFLLQSKEEQMYKQTLIDTMWSGLPKDKALQNLNTTIYYLRKFLKDGNTDVTLIYKSGYYSLNLGNVISDIDVFEKAEELASSICAQHIDYVLYAANLYRGKYFEDVKCEWANLLRDQYHIRYVNLRIEIAMYYANTKQYEASNEQATLAINADPLCETAWILLITNYQKSGDEIYLQRTLENRKSAYKNLNITLPNLEL